MFVVCCALCWFLFTVGCLLFVVGAGVCCLLFVGDCCLAVVVRCLLCVVVSFSVRVASLFAGVVVCNSFFCC